MDHPAKEEELELFEDYSSGSKRSSTAGQEQGLLGGWKDQDAEQQSEATPYQQRRRKGWSWMIWLAVSAAIVLGAIVGVNSLLGYGTSVATQKGEGEGVQSSDYVLDMRWDRTAHQQRREYSWVVRDQDHNPDGVYRPMMLVNNMFPGPLIEANEGDTIVVHVENRAINATSIHWHGLYQNGTPAMDGTVGVTGCAIAPNASFTYEFTVSGQSGTYWWHAHQGVQSSDGVHGPIVIHAKNEKELQQIPYASDRILMIGDHYHELSSALLWQYLKPDMENAEPVPEGGLINGRSVRNCDDYPHWRCDNTSSCIGPATLDLEPDQSHRLRIINVGAFAEFQVQIDEHELAVTEVDGTDVVPLSYHRININPAQRYSVIVNTTSASSDSFWLRARMITRCFTDPPQTLDPEVRAIVRYSDKSSSGAKTTPTSIDWEEQTPLECRDMNTTELKPVQVIEAPAKEDAFFYFRSNFEIGNYRLSRGVFDSSSWRATPRSPTFLRAIDGLAESNVSYSSAAGKSAFINDVAFDRSHELVLQTTGIQTVDILVSNFDDGNHPLHLHGYKYFVLAQGHGYPPQKSILDGITRDNVQPLYDTLDLSNPLRRDTASVEAFGWILLRLVTDNPGAWAFHCHVSWHTEAGLLMQFLTRTDELAKMQIPMASRDLCAAEGLERGMGPKDEEYWDLAK